MKIKFFKKYLFIFIIVIVIVFLLFFLSNNNNNNTKNKQTFQTLSTLGNKTFKSSSKYADVEFTTSEDAKTIYVKVQYKDLTGVSAIHIHVNNNGKPGPILAWLGTTNEWQLGVAQNTPGSNAPCCSKYNRLCTLAAPESTPKINNLSNSVMEFTFRNYCCNGTACPWIENGTLLDVHGFNFKKVINGKLTSEPAGADIISNTAFTLVNN
jgi:hypothetical protein